jgi:hypothetical protein
VDLVTNEVPEEHITSIIRDKRIGEPGITLAATSNRNRLADSFETSFLTRAARRNIPEDDILGEFLA